MPADVVHAAAPKIESTFKAREVEGVLDLYFYRPIGFWLAQFFARLKMTPAAVSLLAGIFGFSMVLFGSLLGGGFASSRR